jgi:hypothetical protein
VVCEKALKGEVGNEQGWIERMKERRKGKGKVKKRLIYEAMNSVLTVPFKTIGAHPLPINGSMWWTCHPSKENDRE